MDTTILIKTKKDIKLQAQELAKDLGLSLADVVNASLRQFVINQGITISKMPAENIDVYSNKKEIISSYLDSNWETIADFTKINKNGVSAKAVLKELRKLNA